MGWRIGSDRSGAAAVEYALLAGLIAAALVGVLLSMGAGVNQTMHEVDQPIRERLVIRQ